MEKEEEIKEIAPKSIFKNKNYLLLFQGTLTSSIAAQLYNFIISNYILYITNDNAIIQGAYLGMCGIVFVLVSFIGGILADRWNKAKIVYLSDLIKGITILISLIFISIFISTNNTIGQVIVLFIIGFINNAIHAVFTPASSALIPVIVETEQLQKANSLFSLLNSFVSIIGAILGGILYNLIPIEIFFLIIGICYILSGVSEIFIRVKHIKKEDKITFKLMVSDLKDGVKYLLPMKGIVFLILGILFINFFMTPLSGNLIPYMVRTQFVNQNYMLRNIIQPELWIGIFMVMMAIGSIIMSIIMGTIKPKKNGFIIKFWILFTAIITILLTINYVLFDKNIFSINTLLIVMCILMVLLGVSLVGVNIPISVVIQKNVSEDYMAKVWSIISIGTQGLCPIASLIGGVLLEKLGISSLLCVCSSGFLLVSILICSSKKVKEI